MTHSSPANTSGAAMHAYYCDEIKIDGSDIGNASGAVFSPWVFAIMRHGCVFQFRKINYEAWYACSGFRL